MAHNPIDHVVDHPSLEFPGLSPIPLPFGLTRFMVMELVAAVLICAIFIPLARHIAGRPVTRGRLRNAFEAMILFVRDGIVKQGLHGHHARKFLPFFLTLFFFILFNNLLGQIPGGATATANINVTGALALMIFVVVLYYGVEASGLAGFWLNLVPHLDVPKWMFPPLWVLLFLIETLSLFIKHMVLAIRLFANMFGGHTVQAVVLGFILVTAGTWTWWIVTPMSLGGGLALLAMELFVACLQAYVFCLLSSLFIGNAVEPHH